MNAITQGQRIESKYIGPSIAHHHLLGWINTHGMLFEQAYPDRQVNSVYFDSPELGAYSENLAGVSARNKVRYRWYGDVALPGAGVLEVKQKRNNFGTKKHFSCEVAPCQVGDDWAAFMVNLRQQLSDEGRVWLHSAGRPVLLNRYQRQYFVSKDQQIRLTVDTQLQVYDQRYHSQPNILRRSQLLPNWVVMECKIGRHARQGLHDLLKGCPLRMSRHSKYVNGVRSIDQY